MNRRLTVFLGIGLLVALVLAGIVSNAASAKPDGLDATARKGCTFDSQGEITGGDCIARHETKHDSPLAGYGNSPLSTGLSGVAGVLIVAAIGGGLFWVLRRRPSTE